MLYNEYLEKRKPYQEYGFLFLLEKKHACLFYKPGKGKTYPSIDAMREVDKIKNGKANVLILSTADAVNNMWNTEIVPQNILPKNTIIMSFNKAIQEKTKKELLKIKWDIILVDECHKIKSNTSKTSKLVYYLSRKAEFAWGLTGTPRGNTDLDIFCQFHNLNISEWGTVSYTAFVQNCCTLENKFFGGKMIPQPTGILPKYIDGWNRNIMMYSQRIEYSEEDDMPPLNVNLVKLDYIPTPEYKKAEDGVIAIEDYESTMTKLVATLKMQQAVNGYLYITNEDIESKREIYRFQHNTKLDWLLNNVINDSKVTIVYRFAADLEDIQKTLPENSFTDDVDVFKTDKNVKYLLLQCSRCESFNLQMSKRIVFYTLDYSYIKYNQMLHRVWRMGQTEPVQIDVLVFGGSIEDKIWEAVQRKQKFADLFMAIKGE